MANSRAIANLKNNVIKKLILDERIVNAIDAKEIADAEELIGTHIFDFAQDTEVINESSTIITVTTNIITYTDYSEIFSYVYPNLVIDIYTHSKRMKVDNIPKVENNRNDYISMVIDDMLNGKYGLGGVGKLTLIGNVEGSKQKDWLYRKMTFQTTDVNSANCNGDEEYEQ